MPVNKLALLRYKTIDSCLQNRRRKWTIEDIIDKVSDVLYEKEGIENGVSKRTIQYDIQTMKSDKLGYNAPIIIYDKKYYTYEDSEYTITKLPMSNEDVQHLKELIGTLKHMQGFAFFNDLFENIIKLESAVLSNTNEENKQIIQFETNPLLKGLEFIQELYQAIQQEKAVHLKYKSFKSQAPTFKVVYPYLLKEYRNRWFVLLKEKDRSDLQNYALDRIEEMHVLANEPFKKYDGVPFEQIFENVIGVTFDPKQRQRKVVLWVEKRHAPYVVTKPIHHSQKILKEDETGTTFELSVCFNFEFERELMGFGNKLKVLSPRDLRNRISKLVTKMARLYDED